LRLFNCKLSELSPKTNNFIITLQGSFSLQSLLFTARTIKIILRMSEKKYSPSLLVFAYILVFISCSNRENVSIREIEDGQKVISIDASWFEIEDDFKGRFEVDYIPLETTEKALIGVIDDLKVIGDRVFLFDRDVAKALFIYNANGMYIDKITATGMGPNEINFLRDFTINRERGEVIVNDLGLKRIGRYDFDGNLISVEKNELWFTGMEWLYGDTYLYYLSHLSVDENRSKFGPLVVLGDINGKVESEYFKLDNRPSYLTIVEHFGVSNTDEEVLLTKKFDQNIYTLNEEGELISKLKIDFGSLNIEKDYREIDVKNFWDYENENAFAQVLNAYSTNSHYAITYTNPVVAPGLQVHLQSILAKDGSFNYLYNANVNPDKDGVMLPSIRSSDSDFFYGFYEAEDFLRANNGHNNIIAEQFFGKENLTIGDSDNPILVRIKVKDEK
jgi:hypothetical protein